jgi:hypothetical protein
MGSWKAGLLVTIMADEMALKQAEMKAVLKDN